MVKIGTIALAHVRHQPGGDTLVVFIGDSVVMWQQDGILRAGLERNISQVSNLLPAPTSRLSPLSLTSPSVIAPPTQNTNTN